VIATCRIPDDQKEPRVLAAGLTALLRNLAEIIGRNRLQNLEQRWVLVQNEICRGDYLTFIEIVLSTKTI
jgi:hypothetical protein